MVRDPPDPRRGALPRALRQSNERQFWRACGGAGAGIIAPMRRPGSRTVSGRSFFGAGRAGAPLVLAALALTAGCGSVEEPRGISSLDGEGARADDDDEAPLVPEVDGSGLAPSDGVSIGGACSGRVAAETFTSALCSCEDTRIAGYLRTRSARPGDAGEPERLGGSVGVNGDYVTAGYADVGGSFSVAGAGDIRFGGLLRAGEDLRLNPAANVAGVVDVGRDAWLAREVRAFGRVAIDRDLYTEAGAGFRGIALVDVGGTERTQAVTVEAPCACGAGDVIDVAALVAEAERDNDNAAVGLEADDWDVSVGLFVDQRLPSGRYFVSRIGSVGDLTLHVEGKVALFVAEDLLATGAFRVELEPDAELDLFVGGNLVVTGAARFGDRARPSATRVYVGGSGDIALAGYGAFVGNLYAPTANVVIGGYGQIYGSLFAKNVTAAGFVSVGYDESIRDRGESCPPSEVDVPRVR